MDFAVQKNRFCCCSMVADTDIAAVGQLVQPPPRTLPLVHAGSGVDNWAGSDLTALERTAAMVAVLRPTYTWWRNK
jgi:hypothetical protein